MKKGRILHLEDNKDWIESIQVLIGKEYDLYSVTSKEEAAKLISELKQDGLVFDMAVVDISLVRSNIYDKKGFEFVENLEKNGLMLGHSIIILSGNLDVDENWRIAFRNYDVVDVFDKGKFVAQKHELKKTIDNTIKRLRS